MSGNKDLRNTRASLRNLPLFNDDLVPMREVEWRHAFTIATRDVTDAERAQLWADHLVFKGVAYDWLDTLKASGAPGTADAKDWSKLLPHIEARWPTPKRDPYALAELKRSRWDISVLKVENILAELIDESVVTKPHESWAKQHLSWGWDCGSSDADLVHQTLKRAIPPWMVAMLPKKARYGGDFEGLCKDIGELSS
ncbi:hypothetical protein FRC08_000089 [Ceratobasidium sp. 394]|nr:hypothetical protein FRC08_000089 [Ceratobasidium sp. 394]